MLDHQKRRLKGESFFNEKIGYQFWIVYHYGKNRMEICFVSEDSSFIVLVAQEKHLEIIPF